MGLSLCRSYEGMGGRILYSARLRLAGYNYPRIFWSTCGLRLYFSSIASKLFRMSSVIFNGWL